MKTTPASSIVIPVLNEGHRIVTFLKELQPLRHQGHELIVVDGGSEDGTADLARDWCDKLLSVRPGRAMQMNAGASAASHGILVFLHADTSLPESALDAIASALQDRPWGRFDVRIDSSRAIFRLIEKMMNLRSRLTGVATGDQCLFVRRLTFEQVGGYPAIALMEDIALSKRLRLVSPPACLKQKALTSARRWLSGGVYRTILFMWRLRLSYFLGVSPAELVKAYYPKRGNHPDFKHKNAVTLLFTRVPELGKVKTRLAATAGHEMAYKVHASLLSRQTGWLQASTLCTAEMWASGSQPEQAFRYSGLHVRQQVSGDLGQRMEYAARQALQNYQRVVLIGSDCPGMSETRVAEALEALDQHDVVLVPALDGGYVLLGFKEHIPALFNDMPWSTDKVFALTLERIELAEKTVKVLTPLADIDTESDFLRLADDMSLSHVNN